MEVIPLRPSAVDKNPTFREYLDARSAADLANQRLADATEALKKEMQDKHQKSLSYVRDGIRRTVTYTARTTYQVDEKGLRKALTAKIFDRYTEKKLNRKALEAAMDTGEVDPMVVSKFVAEKPTESYLRFTEKVETDE